jgi:hypothetical protein
MANADSEPMAGVYRRVADELSAEIDDRYLTIITRDVLRESQETKRQMTELVAQMFS